ncbi:hypothetical protein BDZ85DRAFT_103915 [Elsinoe ampelina]|uniref:Uncharacterized protein n=1 Tax=Elsinoe ampelina TaxID=302913 RepID=A0A6A6GFQ1_9PEZI|nr:hypothetical protein BDZ85DRAFT_103915 [Elsinoe ampelina]
MDFLPDRTPPAPSAASTPVNSPPASIAAAEDWNPLARYPSSTPPRPFTPLSMWNKGPGVTERDPFGRHGPFPATLLWQYDGDYEDDLWEAMCKFRDRKILNQALDDRSSVDTQELLAEVYAEEPPPKRRDSLPVPYATQQADKQRRRPVFPRTESAPKIIMTAAFSEKKIRRTGFWRRHC